MKGFLRWLGWLVSVLTVIILANQVPGLQRIDAFTAENRRLSAASAAMSKENVTMRTRIGLDEQAEALKAAPTREQL